MGLQLITSMNTARGILNDPNAVRYSDADLLTYANDSLDQLVGLLPQLFYVEGIHSCVAGTVDQSLSFSTAVSLVKVNRVVGGGLVRQSDLTALDEFDTGWRTAPAGPARNWGPKHEHPLRFMVSPPAPAGQSIEVTYVAIPGEYGATADTGLPTVLSDAIADYIVSRAESRDDEHVNSNRAAQFYAAFLQKVKG